MDWLRERLGLQGGVWVSDFYAYMPKHFYIYLPTREPWPAASVNARLGPIAVHGTKSIPANAWLDQTRPVEQMTWAPGDAGVDPRPPGGRRRLDRAARMSLVSICTGRRTITPGDPAKARPWLDHITNSVSRRSAIIL